MTFPLPAGCRKVCRPNRSRTRHFTANDAARVICSAKKNGATWKQIKNLAKLRGCVTEAEDECVCDEFKVAPEALATVLGILLTALSLMYLPLRLLEGVVAGVSALSASLGAQLDSAIGDLLSFEYAVREGADMIQSLIDKTGGP